VTIIKKILMMRVNELENKIFVSVRSNDGKESPN
jgi:hypothetical protein